jgi:hypothetical protein
MTISVNFATVAGSIAGLTITGITVKGIAAVPTDCNLLTPILYPRPAGFITGLNIGDYTFGTGGTEQMTIHYTLNWRYLHAPIGGGLGGLFSVYSALITNIAAITKKIAESDTLSGAVDIRVDTVSEIGPVADPAGNMFHGCDISVLVTEYT